MKAVLKEKIQREFKNFLVVFVYCWAILGLLALHKSFLQGQRPLSGQFLAIFNAFVLGKVIVVLEMFQVGGKLETYRPINRALFRAVIFGLFLFAFRFLEEQVRGWFHGHSFGETLAEIDGGKLLEMGTLAIIMIVALVPYFTIREIAQVVGGQKLIDILLQPRTATAERRS